MSSKIKVDNIETVAGSGNITLSNALVVNSGITVDNITIDGTEIDLSSGDLTIDVAGDIILDADGGDVKINDGGSARFHILTSATETQLFNQQQDADIVFKGDDGGSAIEAMRIDMSENGQIIVGGTTTGGDQMKINNKGSGFTLNLNNESQSDIILITAQSGTGTVKHHQLNNSNGLVGQITTSGSSTTYSTSSDYRIKENVNYDFDATTRLKQLKPARFNFIADETNTLIDGFIAHEVANIVPEAVIGEKDATEKYIDDNGDEKTRIVPQGLDASKLVPLLVKTIQELEVRISTLESK